MEGVGELLHALILELPSDLIVVDSYCFECVQRSLSLRNIFLDGEADSPMVAEVLDGFQRHSIDGIGADEFLSVEHVAVCRIFCAGAGPEWTLYMRTTMLERLEARCVEEAFELLIDEAGVSNSGPALEGFEL